MNTKTIERRPVFVYGAYGHTGKFVVAELRRRGLQAVLCGRDRERLERLARGETVYAADVDNAAALDEAVSGCAAVLNCAGPFADTADALIGAAQRARLPYLDVTGETDLVDSVFTRYDASARAMGIAIVPACGFYGGLGALLVDAARGDWTEVDDVLIAISLDGWKPTTGTRVVMQRMAGRRWVYMDGKLQARSGTPVFTDFEFPPPLGHQAVMTEYPAPEGALVPRRVRTPNVRVVMSQAALRDLRDPSVSGPTAAFADGSSDQTFMLHVLVRRGPHTRTATATGRDIYATTAPILVAALEALQQADQRAGVLSIADFVDAKKFLRGLNAQQLDLRL